VWLERRGRCLLCAVEVGESLLLKRPETEGWRQELLKCKWPHMNEEVAMRKILSKMPQNRET
jgi:hypothetical protein